jgi:DNA helicase-2/ATP-dependent DNA helicase PcrA
VGATEGLLPIHYAKDEHSMGQERNLTYVAITRAKDTVRLYHAPTNYARGRKRFEKLCRFLDTPAVRKTMRRE